MREEVTAGTPNLDAAVSSSRTRDDRVLSGTRVVVYVIVSFLVLAFAVLDPLKGARSAFPLRVTPDEKSGETLNCCLGVSDRASR